MQTVLKNRGFSLVESIVGVAVFMIVVLTLYQGYARLMDAIRLSRLKTTATALANEQFEIGRNLPYSDVGIIGGIPNGLLQRDQLITRDNVEFLVTTTIRNIDDPFDGTIGGTPNDLSPADYKLMQIDISCPTCKNFPLLFFTTYIAPKNLETTSTNGALFVKVFDANGEPIQGAEVHLENNQISPAISIDDTTNNEGILQVVDAPPGVEAYEITVTKEGYSEEKTYPRGELSNPNPVKVHATVVTQQLTQVSFSIDLLSTLDVFSLTNTCLGVGGIDLSLTGTKLIGTEPNVFKFQADYVTNSSGQANIPNLEWDTYNLQLTDAGYNLIGSISSLPVVLNPNSSQEVKLIVAPKNPNSLLITVKDASTQLPLSDVGVNLVGTDYDETAFTGRGFLRQTDWSGGGGQEDFTDQRKYFDADGNIDPYSFPGEIRLMKIFEDYASNGSLISSTIDTGSASNFHQILWQPLSQTAGTEAKFQIATNNDGITWNFSGPDGTESTFYTVSNQTLNSSYNGNRYLRYKVFLSTEDTSKTPIVADIQITFTSSCVPAGQVVFDGLVSGDYTYTISKSGYQTISDTINISSQWQTKEITLSP